MRFGLERKKLSGATLALRIMEFSALLPPLYVMIAVGYPPLLTDDGLFSFLFGLGASLLPRAGLLGLSWLYKLTAREVLVCFAILLPALFIGLWADSRLRAKRETARRSRIVFAAYLALEFVLHLLPLKVNQAFGTAPWILSMIVLAVCLVLTLLDVRAARSDRG